MSLNQFALQVSFLPDFHLNSIIKPRQKIYEARGTLELITHNRLLTLLLVVFLAVTQVNGIRSAEANELSTFDASTNDPVKEDEIQPEGQSETRKDFDVAGQPGSSQKTLGLNEYLLDTGFGFGFTWAMRFIYVRSKGDRIFDTSFSEWIDNISQPPVIRDGDDFVTNYVNHPLYGALAYLYYRARGHSIWASALGSLIQSTFFEYFVEGLVETPSLIDLIATPTIGTALGIGLENLSCWLIERENKAVRGLGYIINPTRIFVRDRRFGILNQLTGNFELQGSFNVTPNEWKAIEFGYPFFLESPIPLGRIGGSFELVDLDQDSGGQFIFYSLRLDFQSTNNLYGVYIKVPFAGVNNVTLNGDNISDGFEFGNILVGGKLVVINTEQNTVSGGLDVTLPTAFKDNVDRLQAVIEYRRDFPLYLFKAVTTTPYVSAGFLKRGFSLQGTLGIDLIANAENFEGDSFELRIKYGTALGLSTCIPATPTFFVEFEGYTLPTTPGKKNDLFITPGVRLGKKYSPGFGVQVPLTGETADIAKVDFIVDFQARF